MRADKGAGEGAGEGGGEGGPPPPPPVRYVSRIHVEDICAALLASMVQPAGAADSSGIFNLADDAPAPRGEVMAHAAALLGAPLAAAGDADAAGAGVSRRARRRAAEHKRVDNARMRRVLLPGGLRYPTYREGLAKIAQREQRRGSVAPLG